MSSIAPLHALIAIALAVTIAVLPMGHIMMAIPWIIVVAVASKRETKRGRGAFTFATYVVVTLSVVDAAVLAPVKTTERVPERRLPDRRP